MTYDVTFPKLGWEFTVNRVAFTIFGREIYWYGVIIAIGFLLAFVYAMMSCKKMNIDSDKLLNCVLAGFFGGVIGARLYYVAFFPGDIYTKDPMKIFAISDGGLGIYGGILGGLLLGVIAARLSKIKITPILDVACLGFLIGQGIGRWGNFINQEAFGTPTDLPWGMSSAATGNVAVHPTFLYESLWCLLGFVLLHIFTRRFRRYDGQTFLLYLVWYGLERFFVEQLRTDSLMTNPSGTSIFARVSVLVSLICVLAGIVLLVVFRKRTSLAGCGLPCVMALNAEESANQAEPQQEDDESTIFPGEKRITGALEEKAGSEEEEQGGSAAGEIAESEKSNDEEGSGSDGETN